MNRNNIKILIVDDDPLLLSVHTKLLQDKGFDIASANNGAEAFTYIENNIDAVDAVVTDVAMPEMDGYELCLKVKETYSNKNLPIIFISAHDSLDEKLKGYSVGADDYIIKPMQEDEVAKKIQHLLEIRDKWQSLNNEASMSRDMAMRAMTLSSELGQIIEFYKNMLSSENYTELAARVFDITRFFGLSCSIQFRTANSLVSRSDRGETSPLEENLLELARSKGRFFDFKQRTIVNQDHFSLLIKNMPIDNNERYGQIKDFLGMIANGLDSKIDQLNRNVLFQKKDEIVSRIGSAIKNIENDFKSVQQESVTAIEDMIENVNMAIMTLGLLEHQEENIMSILESCLERSNKAFYKGLDIRKNLEDIREQFSSVIVNSSQSKH